MAGGYKNENFYEYTKLSEVRAGKIVNVYGVVKYLKRPFASLTGDCTMIVDIIDPSLPSLENSLTCILFSKSLNELPNIKSVGEIVRFHRLVIGQHNGSPQAKGGKSHGFSWVVVHDSHGDHPNEQFDLDHSHTNYTFTNRDKEKVRELGKWAKTVNQVNNARSITLLEDCKPDNQYKNIICQAISVHPSLTDANYAIIKAWDGTKPVYESYRYRDLGPAVDSPCDALLDLSKGRCVDINIYDDHVENAKSIKPADFLYITNIHQKNIDGVLLPHAAEKDSLALESVDMSGHLVGLILHKGTTFGRGIQILKPEDSDTRTLQSRIDAVFEDQRALKMRKEAGEREFAMIKDDDWPSEMLQANELLSRTAKTSVTKIETNDESNDGLQVRAMQESFTAALHHHIEFTTIREILAFPRVPSKFRCRACVSSYQPAAADEIAQVRCRPCNITTELNKLPPSSKKINKHPKCSNCRNEFTFQYECALRLEDDTGAIDVLILDDDATLFFQEFPVEEMRWNMEARSELESRLKGLIAKDTNTIEHTNEDMNEIPYVECCIQSYTVLSPDDMTNKVCYRIFDTKLF